jgi:haloalkane dehalogenase
MTQWFDALDLSDVTLVCQDWGGLIGLRVAASRIGRFRRLVVANTGLPDSKAVRPEMSAMLAAAYPQIPVPSAADVIEQFRTGERAAFLYWVKYASECPEFSVRDVFGILSRIDDEAVLDGYAAPFPDDRYAAGARQFPSLVPLMPRHEPDRLANDAAWEVLEAYTGPVLTAFSDRDFVTRGGEKPFQQRIPGARGVSHVTIEGGGHFLQEDSAEAFANAIIEFVRQHP